MADLETLLKTMEPRLNPGVFVYTAVVDGMAIDPGQIMASVREPEGMSLIVSEHFAQENKLPILCRCAWITLMVNSDLAAVGFTAAFSTALGDAGISCNVVAGAYHDHIFVPVQWADNAMAVLHSLQSKSFSAQ